MPSGLNLNDGERVTYFAETDSRNKRVKFGIKAKDRAKHFYVIGKTGMGKSTLLENMAVQDIQNGEGIAFIDPHGKTADLLLDYIPEHRVKDVLYFAPFDMNHPVSFNVMEDVGADKRHLVSNGLMSAFKKIWVDAWSARMEYILNNILLALLEYPDSTLIGVNRMLADKDYRNKVVANVTDTSVKAFWVDEFAKYSDKFMTEAGAAIQNKIGQFISNPLVRNLIGQPKSTFDLRQMMDNRKIVIINLSKGRVGESNANLLGSMLITKIYLSAMSRADVSEATLNKLPNFYLYVDEFQSFANESFADILSEARKYKLNLTMAHQYIEQMTEEVRAAVFGNVGTMAIFRVGATDAEYLEKEFAPQFTAEDIVNLGQYQLYLRLMIDGVGSNPFSARNLPPIAKPLLSLKEQIIDSSRITFSRPREVVEAEIKKWHEPVGMVQKKVAPQAHAGFVPSQNAPRPIQDAPRPAPPQVSAPQPVPRPQVQSAPAVSKVDSAAPQTVFSPVQNIAPKPIPLPQQPQPVQTGTNKPFAAQFKNLQSEIPKPISLSELKPQPPRVNDAKKPSEKNLMSLREALAAIKKTEPVKSEIPKQAEINATPKKETVTTPVSSLVLAQTPIPPRAISVPEIKPPVLGEKKNEVPEAVLRKVLEVENPTPNINS